ncbi:uncharacterized protein PG986_004901 [Apiospora aurea]|uniref:Uncharacterized protein n=1 Tax=Apiospora aurea TaxID=335848 RepID=A0ABR1QGE6_9PEZI
MHFRKSSAQDDKASIMSRRSVSLGNPAPTEFAPSKPVMKMTLPDSLGDISSGISWDIPHLGEIDMSAASMPAEQVPRSSELSQPASPPPPPSSEPIPEEPDQRPASPAKRDDAPLSSAIDIILARSRMYAPATRAEHQPPWWMTRSEESAAAAEAARARLQDRPPPAGTELYLVYPVDSCNAQQTRCIDKHLEDSVDAYAMQRSNLFDGVLFWRAFLTPSQLELIKAMQEVLKVEHQPSPKSPRTARPASPCPPSFYPSRANPVLDLQSPARVGKELYQIEPRNAHDERDLRALAGQLEDTVAPGDLYTSAITAGVSHWRAFLTTDEYVRLHGLPELLLTPTA